MNRKSRAQGIVAVQLNEVPGYLQSSELFRTLSHSDDGDHIIEEKASVNRSIEIPRAYTKFDAVLEDVSDLRHLLETFRYWGVAAADVPDFFIDFCIRNPHTLKSVAKDFPELECVAVLNQSGDEEHQRVKKIATAAAKKGCLNILKLIRNHDVNVIDFSTFLAACAGSQLQCMEFIHNHLPTQSFTQPVWLKAVDRVAAVNGFEAGFEWLMNHHPCNGEHHAVYASMKAAAIGNLPCLKMGVEACARDCRCTIDGSMSTSSDLYYKAAEYGHLHCLRLLHEYGIPWYPSVSLIATVEGHRNACTVAAEQGNLECLIFAHEHGCPWDSSVSTAAAEHGNLDCLKYAHRNGCPWNIGTSSAAAELGHIECLKYAYENGCPWDSFTCTCAALYGNLDCLMYAHEQGCPWDSSTCNVAAMWGRLECLRYAHEQGCPWDSSTCTAAAKRGSLECLKYAHDFGCPWDSETCTIAARRGYLECLKYAHEQGCPWDSSTCTTAAENQYLECLKYAHENGCPWDNGTCRGAAEHGSFECLKYAIEHGCDFRLFQMDNQDFFHPAHSAVWRYMVNNNHPDRDHILWLAKQRGVDLLLAGDGTEGH